MCQGLTELRQAMAADCAGFDAALVPPADLGCLLGDAGAIERAASAVSSMAAARMAAAGGGRCPGAPARQVAEALARASGTSLSNATATSPLLSVGRFGFRVKSFSSSNSFRLVPCLRFSAIVPPPYSYASIRG